jgi:hypothetical protein
MDPNALAGMIFVLILVVLVGGGILLYPLSRRLGALLESRIENEMQPGGSELGELRELVAALAEQVERLSDRQAFTEQVLESRSRDSLPRERSSQSDPAGGAG